MCTVTFLPLKKEGFIITSNRDEKTTRDYAVFPNQRTFNDKDVLFPLDPQGGGTWIAMSNNNRTICLLNGAFESHKSLTDYRHSRGKVVLDFFKFENIHQFKTSYNLDQIEPFTLVTVEGENLYEFRWDGRKKHFEKFSFNKPRIWSSVTLYNSDIIKKREIWFHTWLKENLNYNQDAIIDFHTFAGDGDTNTNILMERDNLLKTVSITSVLIANNRAKMKYFDLINKKSELSSMNLISI